jgi:uncharacterized membrane protein YwzB
MLAIYLDLCAGHCALSAILSELFIKKQTSSQKGLQK